MGKEILAIPEEDVDDFCDFLELALERKSLASVLSESAVKGLQTWIQEWRDYQKELEDEEDD